MSLMFDHATIEAPAHVDTPEKKTDYMLVRLLRLIFYRKGITLDDFSRLYQTHGRLSGWSADEIRVRHNNDRKIICSASKLTMYMFNRITYNILRLNIEAFVIVVRDPATGERTIYRSTDKLS